MEARQVGVAPSDARAMLAASGLGYLDFASNNRALFRLMFASDRVGASGGEEFPEASAAFAHLARDVERLRGASPFEDAAAMADATAVWAMAHGLADLLVSGKLGSLQKMSPADRERAVSELILRAAGECD